MLTLLLIEPEMVDLGRYLIAALEWRSVQLLAHTCYPFTPVHTKYYFKIISFAQSYS